MSWKPQASTSVAPKLLNSSDEPKWPAVHELIFGDAQKFDRQNSGSVILTFSPGEALVTVLSRPHGIKGFFPVPPAVLYSLLDWMETVVKEPGVKWTNTAPKE